MRDATLHGVSATSRFLQWSLTYNHLAYIKEIHATNMSYLIDLGRAEPKPALTGPLGGMCPPCAQADMHAEHDDILIYMGGKRPPFG